MQLILLGLPGSGKGTHAKAIAERSGLLHVSTGDMFRDAAEQGTELGKRARQFMSRGELVPDEVTIGMLLERISCLDADTGFVLDGFPRTIVQAEALDAALLERDGAIDAALYIHQVPEEDLIVRLAGRWSCPSCGAIYNELHQPPKREFYCDDCDTALAQRADDQHETVQQRLEVNREQTESLAQYYRSSGKLYAVDGRGEPSDVTERLLCALENVSVVGQRV